MGVGNLLALGGLACRLLLPTHPFLLATGCKFSGDEMLYEASAMAPLLLDPIGQ